MRTLEELKPVLVSVLEKYPVARAGVFGSYARGEQQADSDLDVLVEFETQENIFQDYFGLLSELEAVTGLDVDLVEYQLIKPVLRDNILKDEIRIYHARTTRLLVPVGHS